MYTWPMKHHYFCIDHCDYFAKQLIKFDVYMRDRKKFINWQKNPQSNEEAGQFAFDFTKIFIREIIAIEKNWSQRFSLQKVIYNFLIYRF